MSVVYIEKLFFIFTLSVFSNIYNINCGCFCNSCKGNTTKGNGGGIKKIIIKVTADSINIDGKILNKLEKPNKPTDVIHINYLSFTNIYNVDGIDFNNNYETVIEDNIKNKPYIIAIVEVEKKDKELERYIISFLNAKTDGLFYECKTIKRILILESKNVTDMGGMFCQCSSLEELYFCNIDTSNVRIMFSMFNGCLSLEKLDLSNFNTKNVASTDCIFDGCSVLKKENVIVKDKKIIDCLTNGNLSL